MKLSDIHAFVINVDKELFRYIFFKQNTADKFPIPIEHKSAIPLDVIRQKYSETKCAPKRQRELSHENTICSILREAKEKDWKYVLIFEDDAECRYNKEYITELIEEIPDDCDLCYLGCYIKKGTGNFKKVKNHIMQMNLKSCNIWGFHGVILGKKFYNALLDKLGNQNNSTIADMSLSVLINKGNFKCYIANPLIVFQSYKMNSKQTKSLHDLTFNFDRLEREHNSFVNSHTYQKN